MAFPLRSSIIDVRDAFVDVQHFGYASQIVGDPGNLELRNLERRGMARLASSSLASQVLWETLTRAMRAMRPEMALFMQAILGKSLKRLESGSLRRPCGIVAPLWSSWS